MKRVLAHVGVFVGGLLAGCALFGGTTQLWAWFWGGTNDEALRTVIDPWPLFVQAPTAVLALVVGVAGYLASVAVGIGVPLYACSSDGLRDDLDSLEANRRRRRERLEREARQDQEEAERIVREYGQPTGPKTTRELEADPTHQQLQLMQAKLRYIEATFAYPPEHATIEQMDRVVYRYTGQYRPAVRKLEPPYSARDLSQLGRVI